MAQEETHRHCCRLTMPNDLEYLPVLHGFIRSMAAQVGFEDEQIEEIDLAVEECAGHVIEHAFTPEEDASFDIICRRFPGGLEVCVRDQGIPWDPSLEEEFNPEATIRSQDAKGISGYLMRHLMDRYEFSNLGQEGKQTRLVKYLRGQRVGQDMDVPDVSHMTEPPEEKPEPVEFDVRLMRPEEAIEVSRAVFDCYGYSYAGEFVYYPDRIVAMNQSGALRSAVAVIKDGDEIGGHCALLIYDALPAEVGIAVTKQKFRGQGFARQLSEFLEDEARTMGMKGLQIKEVTAHPYTQKFCRKLGYTDCGFLLAHSPKTLSFKGIADELGQRNSDVLGFKLLQPLEPRELFLPKQHAEIIEKIYANLDIPMTWKSSAETPPSGQRTAMDASVNSLRSLCEMRISQYGEKAVRILKQRLRRMRKEEVRVVELYLNLTDPCTPWMVSEAEELGFFFTGILPETVGGDSIILQYMNGVQVEYGDLVIDRETTQELLAYIRQHDPAMSI